MKRRCRKDPTIFRCLEKNPENRPYMAEIAEHPFLADIPEDDFLVNDENFIEK